MRPYLFGNACPRKDPCPTRGYISTGKGQLAILNGQLPLILLIDEDVLTCWENVGGIHPCGNGDLTQGVKIGMISDLYEIVDAIEVHRIVLCPCTMEGDHPSPDYPYQSLHNYCFLNRFDCVGGDRRYCLFPFV